jgi:hypothetical protein
MKPSANAVDGFIYVVTTCANIEVLDKKRVRDFSRTPGSLLMRRPDYW